MFEDELERNFVRVRAGLLLVKMLNLTEEANIDLITSILEYRAKNLVSEVRTGQQGFAAAAANDDARREALSDGRIGEIIHDIEESAGNLPIQPTEGMACATDFLGIFSSAMCSIGQVSTREAIAGIAQKIKTCDEELEGKEIGDETGELLANSRRADIVRSEMKRLTLSEGLYGNNAEGSLEVFNELAKEHPGDIYTYNVARRGKEALRTLLRGSPSRDHRTRKTGRSRPGACH
jgi:hypothetical protein